MHSGRRGGDDGVPAHLLELESRLEEDEDADLRTGHQVCVSHCVSHSHYSATHVCLAKSLPWRWPVLWDPSSLIPCAAVCHEMGVKYTWRE